VDIPSYYLRAPQIALNAGEVAAIEQCYQAVLATQGRQPVAYTLSMPKWRFLSHLCETQDILVHGSERDDIDEFEPRQSNDVSEFGNRRAVYASSDAIWAMYFAVVNRRTVASLINASARFIGRDGPGAPYYFFSVGFADDAGHAANAWRDGTIYVLPRAGFLQQAPIPVPGGVVQTAQWASPSPVRPLFRLHVSPADFPFLHQTRVHDIGVVQQRAAANPDGFPWLDA
jgi:hypothetical protein